MYNSQTNYPVYTINQNDTNTANGQKGVSSTKIRLTTNGINSRSNISYSREDTEVSKGEEREYYKKTLKGKLI